MTQVTEFVEQCLEKKDSYKSPVLFCKRNQI